MEILTWQERQEHLTAKKQAFIKQFESMWFGFHEGKHGKRELETFGRTEEEVLQDMERIASGAEATLRSGKLSLEEETWPVCESRLPKREGHESDAMHYLSPERSEILLNRANKANTFAYWGPNDPRNGSYGV